MFRPFRWLMGAAKDDSCTPNSVPGPETASVKPLDWPLAEELCNSVCAFCAKYKDEKTNCGSSEGDHDDSDDANTATSASSRPFSAEECDVFANMSTWNECLWRLGLELREDSILGRLSVVTLGGNMQNYCSRCDGLHAVAAARCLRALLKDHCCIHTLTVSPALVYADCEGLLDALYGNEHIEVLTFPEHFPDAPGLCAAFVRAVSSMTALRELRCFEANYVGAEDGSTAREFGEYIKRTTLLTTLEVALLRTGEVKDCALFKSLGKNTSIQTVILRNVHFGADQGERCAAFEDYLLDSGKLEVLSLLPGPEWGTATALQMLSRALAASSKFRQLTMLGWTVNEDSLRAIAAIIAGNSTMRKFRFTRTTGANARYPPPSAEDSQKDDPRGKATMRALLTALRRNTALRLVSLDLSAFTTTYCKQIIEALARHPSLDRVIIQPERHNHADRVCLELRQKGSLAALLPENRRDIGGTPLPLNLLCAKQVSRFKTASDCWHDSDPGPRQGVFALPSFNAVTTLCLKVSEAVFRFHVNDNLARYVCGTMTLRVLSVIIVPSEQEARANAQVAAAAQDVTGGPELNFIEELSANVSLRRLLLSGMNLEDSDCFMLAHTIRSSRHIHDFAFGRPRRCRRRVTETLVEAMAPGFPIENRTLTEFHTDVCIEAVPAWCVVQSTVQRNWALATLAARFVLGEDDARCADALQLMTEGTTRADRNPALVGMICEMDSLDEDHLAKAAIDKRLKVLDSMHGFMRIVGVVRERVECHPHPEGRKQLADLDKYAWLALRRHLRPSFVVKPSTTSAHADDVCETTAPVDEAISADAKEATASAVGAHHEKQRPCSPKKAAKGSWIFRRQ